MHSGGGVDRLRLTGGRSWEDDRPRAGTTSRRLAVIVLATAAVVTLAGGGDAFWLCLPAALVACAASRTPLAGALGTAVVVGAAAGAALLTARGPHALPSPTLLLLVPGASAAVLISVRNRLERERATLRDFALSDPLTGIANRRVLLSRAEYEIARHLRAHRCFAVVMIDLDGFKLLNDRFGHAAGDDLLRDVAGALTRSMRAQDTVARIGGDEFCVLAPETDEDGTERLVTRITEAVSAVAVGLETVRTSVGIAICPPDGVTAVALIQAADEALLAAKRDRRRDRAQRRAA